MIRSIIQMPDNLVEFTFTNPGVRMTCEVKFSINGTEFAPASLYYSRDKEDEENGSCSIWNEAQSRGIVRMGAAGIVYWNPYVNLGDYTGKVFLKIGCVNNDATFDEIEAAIEIADQGIKYCTDWQSRTINSDGLLSEDWGSYNGEIESYNRADYVLDDVLRIKLPVTGEFEIYLGYKSRVGRYMIKLGEENYRRFITGGSSMALYQDIYHGKLHKEIFWNRKYINHDYLKISPLKETSDSFHNIGDIPYIKLIPVEHSRAAEEQLPEKEFILYYEPYSYASHGFHNEESMNSIMLGEFMDANPDEISCQVCRVGMKTLHNSTIIEKIDMAANTDENVVVDDPMRLARSCDILKESAEYMKNSPIKLSVNLGMNRPYLWLKEISDKFTQENPQLLDGGYFDYSHPEVMEYVKSIIGEFVDNYDIQGFIFDYMRTHYNQTVETLVETVKYAKMKLMAKSESSELKVRIPANDPTYFQAMKISVSEGFVDGIIPSNMISITPYPPVDHYINLCKGTGTKVYGCIDGWKTNMDGDSRIGGLGHCASQKDFIAAWKFYCSKSVDGIFIYQGDQYTANPYIRPLF